MPYWYLSLVILMLDQVTKWLVQTKMVPMQSISLIRGLFSFTYATNYGAAFGILQSRTLLLIAISMGVIIILWVNRRKMNQYPRVMQVGLAVALGGALGNLIDRIRLGFVVDFLDFYIWPIFNVADMAIVIGVALIALGIFSKDQRKGNQEPEELRGVERAASREEKS